MILLFNIFNFLFRLLNIAILARVLLSWIPHNPYHPAIEAIYKITEPILSPFRNLIPPEKLGGLDLSPIFAFFVLDFVKGLLLSLIF